MLSEHVATNNHLLISVSAMIGVWEVMMFESILIACRTLLCTSINCLEDSLNDKGEIMMAFHFCTMACQLGGLWRGFPTPFQGSILTKQNSSRSSVYEEDPRGDDATIGPAVDSGLCGMGSWLLD